MKARVAVVALLAAGFAAGPAVAGEGEKNWAPGALKKDGGDRAGHEVGRGPMRPGGLLLRGEIMDRLHEGMLVRLLDNQETAKELGLTDDQIARMKEVRERFRGEMEDKEKERNDLALAQARLFTGDSIDETAAVELVEKIGKLNTELAILRMKRLIALRNVLGPEQIARLKELLKKRGEEIRERMRGEGPGGGDARRGWGERRREGQGPAGEKKDWKEWKHPKGGEGEAGRGAP